MSTCPAAGGMRPIDALRSSRQQLPREDVTVHVRGAVVRAEEKGSTLVVALLVLVFYGANATENITLLRTLAGHDGRLRPIRPSKSRWAVVVGSGIFGVR